LRPDRRFRARAGARRGRARRGIGGRARRAGRGYDLAEDDRVDALRTIRAALHGFAVLEAAGGFGLPRDVDATFERYVDALDAGLGSWSSKR